MSMIYLPCEEMSRMVNPIPRKFRERACIYRHRENAEKRLLG